MVNADVEAIKYKWERLLLASINRNRESFKYVLLRTVNQYSLAIFLFVRSDKIDSITNISVSAVKVFFF